MKKIDVEFNFRGRHYDAVIRILQKPSGREFYITVLDWELERLLYGNQVMNEVEGYLQTNVSWEKKDQTELKLTIAGQLSKYMQMPCFAGDVCVNPAPIGEGWAFTGRKNRPKISYS